ncbi:ABC transporter ATP-binding protein [Radiobacillus deserti]|uniref:ABC transporter ATP-binding protein n=1 Tax=Radiobacillus deserti TaxID=2594883 RepID=A0A516KGR1_9BACI|nr:ABC transporter ATP-binding protein [Radiobacillus deserti]QDP40590.1 ABC transporter ATP-binding protein [Radiobacillus deserti]
MIQVNNLSHQFVLGKKGEQRLTILENISLQVTQGEIVAVIGRSGSGKSTLLNLISGFIRPTSGEIIIDGENVTEFNETQYANFRLENLGFIFQNFQLIPSLTAYQNIELPLIFKGETEVKRKEQTMETLKRVGLESYKDHYPSELSGGQQQRVSIARALVSNPPIILADEPTGSLDSETEAEILDFINVLNRDYGITFLMITHDNQVARIAHRTIEISDGKLTNRGQAV